MARLLRKEEISFSARPRGWRLSLERNKALDPGQISFFSRKAVMPKAQTLVHLLEQFGLARPVWPATMFSMDASYQTTGREGDRIRRTRCVLFYEHRWPNPEEFRSSNTR